jgi:hypothetical protein
MALLSRPSTRMRVVYLAATGSIAAASWMQREFAPESATGGA